MKKNIFLLAFCSFLLSQDNSTSGKWYIGISREGGDSFVLGNSESGWRYAISYDYNKDRRRGGYNNRRRDYEDRYNNRQSGYRNKRDNKDRRDRKDNRDRKYNRNRRDRDER